MSRIDDALNPFSMQLHYRGFEIHWTGWKPRFTEARIDGRTCAKCQQPIQVGDSVKVSQGAEDVLHADCDGNPNWILAQWTAWRGKDGPFFEVCAGNKMGLFVHQYERGADFPVEFNDRFTHKTPKPVLDQERDRAFRLLLKHIDDYWGQQ